MKPNDCMQIIGVKLGYLIYLEYVMSFNQTGDISARDGSSLKLVDKFTYLGSSVSSTEKDIDTRLTKAWTAIDKLSIVWKSDLTDKIKHSFFQAAVISILLYGCTTWTLTKRLEKNLDTRMLRAMLQAILNKPWGGSRFEKTNVISTFSTPKLLYIHSHPRPLN